MGVVSAHQLSAFSSPVNGTTPIDANTVRGNDNSIRTSYNAHDADGTIHVQNGLVASRPAAATAGNMWLASDTGAVYLYLDTGSAWVEANYLRSTGGTITGTLIVTAGIVVTGGGQFSRTAATDTNVVVDSPTGNGGMVRFRDAGTDKWLVGKAASGGTGTDYEIYNAALGALAFKLTAAASTASFSGIVQLNTTVSTSASAGDLVLPNVRAVRGVTATGTDTFSLIKSDSNNYVVLGSGTMGTGPVKIPYDVVGSFSAGSAANNGVVGVDSTNNRLVYYSGGNRYFIAGTAF